MAEEEEDSSSYSISCAPPPLAGIPGIKYEHDDATTGILEDRTEEKKPSPIDTGTQQGTWREETDQESGNTFYYNNVTFESRWERPTVISSTSTGLTIAQTPSFSSLQSQEQTIPGIDRAKNSWSAVADSKTGNTYYFEEVSGVSQWDKPLEFDDGQPQVRKITGDILDAQLSTNNLTASEPEGEFITTSTTLVIVDSAVTPDARESFSEGVGQLDGFKSRNSSEQSASRVIQSLGENGPGIPSRLDEDRRTHLLRPTSSQSSRPKLSGEQPSSGEFPVTLLGGSRKPDFYADNIATGIGPVLLDRQVRCDVNQTIETIKESSPSGHMEFLSAQGKEKGEGQCQEVNVSNSEHKATIHIRAGDEHVGFQGPLARVDSSSTISTCGGGLDSLAQYVTGHSSTLDKGTVVGLQIPSVGEGRSSAAVNGKNMELPTEESLNDPSATEIQHFDKNNKDEMPTGSEPMRGYTSKFADLPLISVSGTDPRRELVCSPSDEELGGGGGRGKGILDQVPAHDGASLKKQPVCNLVTEDWHIPNFLDLAASDQDLLVPTPPVNGSPARKKVLANETPDPVRTAGFDGPSQGAVTVRSPASFKVVATSAMASKRLQSGMLLKRQQAASVKLQAQARRWAAREIRARLSEGREIKEREGLLRRQHLALVKIQAQARRWTARQTRARLLEHHGTRQREERDAKERAATAIQAFARERWAGMEYQPQTLELGAQQAENEVTEGGMGHIKFRDGNQLTQGVPVNKEEMTASPEVLQVHRPQWQVTVAPILSNHDYDDLQAIPSLWERTSAHGQVSSQEKKSCLTEDGHEKHDGFDKGAYVWDEAESMSNWLEGKEKNEKMHRKQRDDLYSRSNDDYVEMDFNSVPLELERIDEVGRQHDDHQWEEDYADCRSDKPVLQRNFGSFEKARLNAEDNSDERQGLKSSGQASLCDEESVGGGERGDYYGDWSDDEQSNSSSTGRDKNSSEDIISVSTSEPEKELYGCHQSSTSEMSHNFTPGTDIDTGITLTNIIEVGHIHEREKEKVVLSATAKENDRNDKGERARLEVDSEGVIRKEVYQETAAPQERLDDMRSLVAGLAEATARMTMVATGTDPYRLEAAKIMELADREERAANLFQEAIRHSIAIDHGDASVFASLVPVEAVSPRKISGYSEYRSRPRAAMAVSPAVEGLSRSESNIVRERDTVERTDQQKQGSRFSAHGAIQEDMIHRREIPEQVGEGALNTSTTTAIACTLTLDLRRLIKRQQEAVCELIEMSPNCGPHPWEISEVSKPMAALGQLVGLQARAVGLMEEVVERTVHSRLDARTAARAARKAELGHVAESFAENVKVIAARHQHAAKRMEAAPDPIAAQQVADDIRSLSLEQKQLIHQIQQFILSVNIADFNDTGEDSISRDGDGHINGVDSPGVTLKKRIESVAAAVIHELQKGVDVGSIAAARAQAIRRGSQASRLADELRRIASTQAITSLPLAEAGAQLLETAMAEKPLPRDYILPQKGSKIATGATAIKEAFVRSRDGACDTAKVKDEFQLDSPKVGVFQTYITEGRHAKQPDLSLSTNATTAAVVVGTTTEMAIRKEEKSAAARIQSLVRHRRQEKRVTEAEAGKKIDAMMKIPTMTEPTGSDGGWLGAAVCFLRQAINVFLSGKEIKSTETPVKSVSPSSSREHSMRGIGPNDDTTNASGTAKGMDDTASGKSDTYRVTPSSTVRDDSHEDYEDDDDWHAFPPVPLRARAPSLYTLPIPGDFRRRRNDGGGGDSAPNSKINSGSTNTDLFTKLDPDVAARLCSVRTVFGLRASDVLAAFSPPPLQRSFLPPTTENASRPHTVPGTVDQSKSGRKLSPRALRQRLCMEAEDAFCAGLGRPWGSSWRPPHAVSYRQLSGLRKEDSRENCAAGSGTSGKMRKKRRRIGAVPLSAVGRHLRQKRFEAMRASHRRLIIGATDAFRVRHAGRQLRSGAAASALEEIGRALDFQLCVAREKREVSLAHTEQLLEVIDQLVFSDSQLVETCKKVASNASNGETVGDINSQESRCQICQELLSDLRRNFPVVREQESWENDVDPFCCDACYRSPLAGEFTTPPVDHDDNLEYDTVEIGNLGVGLSSSHHTASEASVGSENNIPVAGIHLKIFHDDDAPEIYGEQLSRRLMASGTVEGNQKSRCSGVDSLPGGGTKSKKIKMEAGENFYNRGEGTMPSRKGNAAAAFAAHLHGVDMYPLELARLCRFAQFLTGNGLLREAYEVVLHAISSSAITADSTNTERMSFPLVPLLLPPGLGSLLFISAGRLAAVIGRYSEAVRHVKMAVRTAVVNVTRESPAVLVASSRLFEFLRNSRSAETLLLGCLLLQPDYAPALSDYGKLAACKSELGVAERYLKRATYFSSWKTLGEDREGGRDASDWIALMNFLSEDQLPSTQGVDATKCFRKALACLNLKCLEQGTVLAQLSATSPATSTAVFSPLADSRPSANTLLDLGRFELLQNRNVERAVSLFKACLEKCPWHSSAKMHLAFCLLGQLGPFNDDRAPSRAVRRIDALFRSALKYHGHGRPSISAENRPPAPIPASPYRESTCSQTIKKHHRMPPSPIDSYPDGPWLLWAFYSKFAERCLHDPGLALYALDRASAAASSRKSLLLQYNLKNSPGGQRSSKSGEIAFALIARAQLCQRWPELEGGTGHPDDRVTVMERMFDEASERCPNEPAAHTALGYFLLSKDREDLDSDALERAITAFRKAVNLSNGDNLVRETRGLAVALSRRSLGKPVGGRHTASDSIPDNNREDHQKTCGDGETPHNILLNSLEASNSRERKSVALLRTVAMHLYAWRGRIYSNSTASIPLSIDVKVATAANKALGERRAEILLSRAVELEPFHVPTLAVLAFILLQSGRKNNLSKAEHLLDRAIRSSGRRVPSDVLRVLAQIRASQGRRLSAKSLFRRVTARPLVQSDMGCPGDGGSNDPLSLLGLAKLIMTPTRKSFPPLLCPPLDKNKDHDGVSSGGDGPETDTNIPTVSPGAASAEASSMPPSSDDKSETAQLLARAFAAAGGAMPLETVYFGRGGEEGDCNDAGVAERGCIGGSDVQGILAEVHLAVSGFSIKGQGDGVAKRVAGKDNDGAKEWHLREAARGVSNSKAGIIARYILGRRTLAAGDDRKAELLFLEALDAEPISYGACAAFLSVLRQVSIDVAKTKSHLNHLKKRLGKRKARRGSRGRITKENAAARLPQPIESARRSLKLLERLEVYASLRKRYAGDTLRGPGLASLEWALALEEGWEVRYRRVLESGDGWTALFLLR